MLYLRTKYIHSENYVKVGWMNGLKWTKTALYDYNRYSQIWHSDRASPMQYLHAKLEKTKLFKQHQIAQWTNFIVWCVRAVNLLIFILFGMKVEAKINVDVEITTEWEAIAYINGIILAISPIIAAISKIKLKRALKDYLVKLNRDELLRNQNLSVNFHEYSMWFCCFRCFNCCLEFFVLTTDFKTIQIWQNIEQTDLIDENEPLLTLQNKNHRQT